MPASKSGVRVRFRIEQATVLANKAGIATEPERATFFGVTQSNWSRVTSTRNKKGKPVADPGALFIAAVLTSPAAVEYPKLVTFDELFEVVRAA